MPPDLILLEVNRSFEAITGLPGSQVVGRRISESMPGIDMGHLKEATAWLEAGEGEPYRFDQFVEGLGRHFEMAVVASGRGQCAIFLADITDRLRAEKALEDTNRKFARRFRAVERELAARGLPRPRRQQADRRTTCARQRP